MRLRLGQFRKRMFRYLAMILGRRNIVLRNGSQVRKYYTFDHRRLWCMCQAGCPRLRFQVEVHMRLLMHIASLVFQQYNMLPKCISH